MKRDLKKRGFLLFAIFCVSMVNAFAQDVILKKDGSEVKAKVLEVSDQQIKYKEFDFQTGPTRIINTYEVFMITYENGKKEVYNKQAPAPVPTTTYPTNPYYQPPMDLKTEFDRIGDNDDEMLNFFRRNNFTEYVSKFDDACGMRNTGKRLLTSGLTLVGCGALWIAVGFGLDDEDYYWMGYTGIAMASVGNILTIVSIPVSAGGGARKRAIKNDFAREKFGFDNYTYQPTLNFGITKHGIGLTFNF